MSGLLAPITYINIVYELLVSILTFQDWVCNIHRDIEASITYVMNEEDIKYCDILAALNRTINRFTEAAQQGVL